MNDPAYWAMSASLVFLAVILLKLRVSFTDVAPGRAAAKQRFAAAQLRARQAAGVPKARAAALRDAARLALDELERPALAARLARRADKLDPTAASTVETLVRTMSAAGKYHALERLLWKHLDESRLDAERFERTFAALLSLYDGPLKRPHQASVLRRLRGSTQGG